MEQIRPLLYWGSLPVSVNMVGCWKKVILFTFEPEKAPRKPFQTGFRPIRFLNCIGVHKILNIFKCKHGWAHEYFLCYGWNFLNRSILYDTSVTLEFTLQVKLRRCWWVVCWLVYIPGLRAVTTSTTQFQLFNWFWLIVWTVWFSDFPCWSTKISTII